MNWGYRILTIYIIFIAGILFLVFKASSQNQDLVAADYYEQELKFQERIDETSRANALSASIDVKVCEQSLLIAFPAELKGVAVNANILLYCSADKKKDWARTASTSSAAISLPLAPGQQGVYDAKITWTANDIRYYSEQKLIIK
jgi:hypothetical protein